MSRTRRKLPTNYLRHIKTNNERKQIDSAQEQGVKVRGKRNKRNLPDAWDDKPVASYKECFIPKTKR